MIDSSPSMPSVPSVPSVQIRALTDVADFDVAVDLQRRVWGSHELETVPTSAFVVASRFGGQVLGAFDNGRMVGFSLAFYASRNGHAHLHSDMVGILASHQNRGIGKLLKLAQRADALERGIDRLEWTFDPLQARNAHFNIERLGGVVRNYLENLYGITTSPLHGGMPTDRLLVEWELNSPRVVRALENKTVEHGPDSQLVEWHAPGMKGPADLAAQQARLRESLPGMFDRGYAITGFVNNSQHTAYVLEKL